MASREIDLEFNPDLFNEIYWEFMDILADHSIRYLWVKGGSSASKTYSLCQAILVLIMSGSDENHLVMRKVGADIQDSIYSDFVKIIRDWEVSGYFTIIKNHIIFKPTGSYIRFRGLDDPERVKGISNFKRVILEEVSEFDERDLKQLRKRLRGKVGQQIISLFNPIDEEHWIKVNVFDTDDWEDMPTKIRAKQINKARNTIILHTYYGDNKYIVGPHFIDEHVIADFEKDKISDYNYYRIYGLGEWGRLRTGGEFWKDFDTNLHIKKFKWDEDLPLHITWDENVNPYLTCLVWQISKKGEKKVARQVDEICLPDPRNRVVKVCHEFMSRYPLDRVKGLFVYGDRTSIKEDTKMEKGENFFTKIIQELKEYRPSLRIASSNPSVVQSAGFVNQCYAGNTDVEIEIAEHCKKSIFDYQYALEDSDGTLKKSKKTNPVTKVSYEEFGHPSDAKRYLFTVAFANEYATYLRGNSKRIIKTGKPMAKSGY